MQAPGVQNLWIYRPERTPVEIRKRNNVHVIDAIRPDVPVLVYAHGFGCSQHMWRHITPAFEGKCRQVLFDYVGCGQSDFFGERWTGCVYPRFGPGYGAGRRGGR